MPYYSVKIQNDMGHLEVKGTVPKYIRDFCFSKASQYVTDFTHTRYYNRFYGLKDGLQKKWTYYLGSDTVEIEWDIPMASKYRDRTDVRELTPEATRYDTSVPFSMTPTGQNTDYGISSGGMSAF